MLCPLDSYMIVFDWTFHEVWVDEIKLLRNVVQGNHEKKSPHDFAIQIKSLKKLLTIFSKKICKSFESKRPYKHFMMYSCFVTNYR
jgi:hypothetical protein